MKRLLSIVAVIVVAIAASASAQRALTRPTAQQAIAANSAFASASVLVLCDPANTVKAGVREGLWTEQGFGGLAITPAGHRCFSSIDGFPDYKAHLVGPAKRTVVAVTGITDNGPGGSEKLVLFTWRYSALPEVVSRYTCQGGQPHEGHALVRLFDDGWRVQNLELPENHRVAFTGVSAAVAKNEADAASRRVQADRISRVATSTMGTYRFSVRGRNPNGAYQTNYQLQVTDVSVRLLGNRTAWGEKEVWFGDIDRVELRSTIIDGVGPQVPELLVWHRDGFTYSSPLIQGEQNVGNLSDLPGAQRALAQAVANWRRWYNDMLSGAAPLSPRGGADAVLFVTSASKGNAIAVRDQIRLGVDLEATDSAGQTALILAAAAGHAEIVAELIKAGANINARDQDARTPLDKARLGGHSAVVKLLVAAGAKDPVPTTPFNAMWRAIEDGRDDQVRALLAGGFNASSANEDGMAALLYALRLKRKAVVRTLLQSGANVNQRDRFGFTPLGAAFDTEVATWLLQRGARVNDRNNYGVSVLAEIVGTADPNLVELLIAHGADVNARDSNGRTPLKGALELASAGYAQKYRDVIAVLRKHGARE
jgi:ankyrin repeat protein